MKKKYKFLCKSFLWFALLVIFPVLQTHAQLSTITKPTTSVMVIDADPTDWWGIPSDTAKIFTAGGTAPLYQNAADFSVTFKTAWDSKKFYLYADIKDDIKVKTGTFYLMDNLELWLDVNNSKGTALDGVDDITIRINRDTVLVNSAVGNNTLGNYPWTATSKDGMKGMEIKQKEVSGGYIVELSIPWDSIQMKNTSPVVIGDGTTIGFNAYFCDQDSTFDRGGDRTKLMWASATAGGSNPSTWGTATLTGSPLVTDISSQAIQNTMIIDGDIGDWANITSIPVALVNYGDANLTGTNDFSGSFKTTWDAKNLYFQASIKDDIKVKTGTFYLSDNIELGIDVDNSKMPARDGINDVNIRINRDTTFFNTAVGNNVVGDYPWTATSKDGMRGMVIKQKEVADGWQLELSIPWDSLQMKMATPAVIGENSKIGLRVYFCDQDSLKDRGTDRTKLLWINATAAPSTWGTVTLTGTPAVTELNSQAIVNNMVIDGDLSDWANITSTAVAFVNYGAANLTGPDDFSGSFKTTWDAKNLYIQASIKDDIKVKTGTFYLSDNIELGIDVDNSKMPARDGINDVNIRINRDTIFFNTAVGNNVVGDYPWTATSKDGMRGMVIKQTEVADGWQLELSIPWDSLQMKMATPAVIGENSKIGLRVYFCDQDSLKDRGTDRTKLLWINASGAPSTWGTLTLTGTPFEGTVKTYYQRFINTTGANVDASTVGWKAYSSSQASEVLSTAGFQGGISGGLGTVVSSDDNDKGYIFLYSGAAVNLLSLSNTRITRSVKEISEIGFVMRERTWVYTCQVAVRIAGQWYVNEQVFQGASLDADVTEYNNHAFTWTSSNWKKLIFDQSNATTLAISSDAAGDLPAGDLENFGVYAVNPGGGSVVIDEVYVMGGELGGPFDAVAPAVPTATATADATVAKISLSWSQVSDNEVGTVTYNVYNSLQLFVGSTTSLSYTVSGLEWDTEYTFYVTSKDLSGNESDFSAAAVATTIADPATGIVNSTLKSSVYPNPVKDMLNISAQNISKVELYNAVGSKVLSEKALKDNFHSISMSNMAKGMYLLKVYDREGNASSRTIVKE